MDVTELISASKKSYIAKIGNTLLARQVSEAPHDDASREKLTKTLAEFPDEMERCLKQASNITNFSNYMKGIKLGHLPMEIVGFFVRKSDTAIRVTPNFAGYMSFQAVWPRKNQEFTEWYSGEVVENFNILYDGSIFLAFAETPFRVGRQYTWSFGLEAMKIIKTVFEASSCWEVTTIGPIMLHPPLRFFFVDATGDTQLPAAQDVDGALYVFFPFQSNENCERDIRDFFRSVSPLVKRHYRSQFLRGDIIESEDKFRQQFETLSSLHRNVLELSSWKPSNIKNRYVYTRQLRGAIRQMYELYVQLAQGHAAINQQRSRASREIIQNPFLAPLAGYFEKGLSDVGKMDHLLPILQGVKFFEDETRAIISQRTIIEAAIFGAAIGAGVAGAIMAAF